MANVSQAPSTRLIDGIGRVRNALDVASRSAVPPNIAVLEMTQGAWLTQALYVAVKLGIADALRDGPKSADEIATAVGAGGSFFDAVPDGGDAYLLKTVIHDWDDEQSIAILRNVRTAIAADGKLLLIELVLPEGAPPHPGMLLDLEMPVQAGGRERTASEYGDLLSQAGFRLTRVIPTAGPMSIVEAVPV